MGDGSGDYQDRHTDRRNGESQRRRDELADHQRNPYAHGELVGRLQREGQDVRTAYENRLRAVERIVGQVVIVAVVLGILLGAGAGVVLTRLLR